MFIIVALCILNRNEKQVQGIGTYPAPNFQLLVLISVSAGLGWVAAI